jgi:hypothetical protein
MNKRATSTPLYKATVAAVRSMERLIELLERVGWPNLSARKHELRKPSRKLTLNP